jgi:hypothetical protein
LIYELLNCCIDSRTKEGYNQMAFGFHVIKQECEVNGLLPKSLFTLSKTFLIDLRLVPGALKTRPPGPAASGIQSAHLPLRQD